MAEKTMAAATRPLLRRVLSFREPLLIIPYLFSFLATAATAFFGSYSSFLQSFARSLFPSAAAKGAYATPVDDSPCHGVEDEGSSSSEEEDVEDAALSREEVEEIMSRIGLAASGNGLVVAAPGGPLGRDEVARLFDAEEPSFAEVRRAFAVFDADGDGFIGAADLRGALVRLGVKEDDAACKAMIAAAGGGRDGRMSLFQFVTFLEAGLC